MAAGVSLVDSKPEEGQSTFILAQVLTFRCPIAELRAQHSPKRKSQIGRPPTDVRLALWLQRSAETSHGERTDSFDLEGRFGRRADAGPDASERVVEDSLAGCEQGAHLPNSNIRMGPSLARFRLQVDPSVIGVVVSSLSASWRFLGPYRSPSVRRGLALARFVRVGPNARLPWS